MHTFKDYITSTKIIYEDIFVKCKKFNWPSEALDSNQLYDFDEGPFLNMIFRKISNIPKQVITEKQIMYILFITCVCIFRLEHGNYHTVKNYFNIHKLFTSSIST